MADTSKQQTKRKRKGKGYFTGGKKRKNEDKLTVGMQGILVFGADHENQAKKEAYNLLNEYADELFGSEFVDYLLHRNVDKKLIVDYQHGVDHTMIVENPDGNDSSEDEDIEKAIAKEVHQMSSVKKDRRFQGVSTGVHAILFIKSTLSKDNLNELVHSILSDVEKTKEKKSRSFQRLIPVTEICHADIDTIRKTVTEKFLPGFNDDENPSTKFCIHFKSRYNDTVTRNKVLTQIAAVFLEAGHKVDLTSPEKVIIVEIMKGICCMSVVKDFFRFKKYNIHAITDAPKDKLSESSGLQDKYKESSGRQETTSARSDPQDNSKESSGLQDNSKESSGCQDKSRESSHGPQETTSARSGPQETTSARSDPQDNSKESSGLQDNSKESSGRQDKSRESSGPQETSTRSDPQETTSARSDPQDNSKESSGPQETSTRSDPQDNSKESSGPQETTSARSDIQETTSTRSDTQDNSKDCSGPKDKSKESSGEINESAGPQDTTNESSGPEENASESPEKNASESSGPNESVVLQVAAKYFEK